MNRALAVAWLAAGALLTGSAAAQFKAPEEAPDELWTCIPQLGGDLQFFAKPVRYWQLGDQGYEWADGEITPLPFRTDAGGTYWIWTMPSSTADNEIIVSINSTNGRGAVLGESTNYALPALTYSCRWGPWQ